MSRPGLREDQVINSSALANAFRVLRQHGFRRQLPLILALTVGSFLEGLSIGTLLPILKTVTTGETHSPSPLERFIFAALDFLHLPKEFGALVLVFAVCMTARAVLAKQTSRVVGRMVAESATDFRKQVLDSVLQARWSYFTVNPVGRFISAVNSETNWASYVYKTSLNVLASLIRAAIYCLIGLLIDWRAAGVALLLGIGLGLVNRHFVRSARRAGRKQLIAMRSLVSDFGDVITGFKPIKAMHRHESLIAGLARETRSIRRAMYDLVVSQQLANALPDLLIVLALVAAVYTYHRLGLDLSAMGVSGILLLRLMSSVSAVQRSLQETAMSESSYWALKATIGEARAAAEAFTGTAAPTLRQGAAFRGVGFAYDEKPVLTDVSLEIPAGCITTLLGESGSGKTTIADLLLGLIEVDTGTITLDGAALDSIDMRQWRSMVGYVPQEVLLFSDTIFENVALGDPAITDADVRQALEDAGALDFVDSLPEGIRTPVGERGAKLSGGQRQRIALARALVHRPTLLILDEATSALDPATEAEICQTVRRQAGTLTVLAITHQAAWVDIADRVYRVAGGTVEQLERVGLTQAAASAH